MSAAGRARRRVRATMRLGMSAHWFATFSLRSKRPRAGPEMRWRRPSSETRGRLRLGSRRRQSLAIWRRTCGSFTAGMTSIRARSNGPRTDFCLGINLGLLPAEGQNLILAGALLSISLNPLVFYAASFVHPTRAAEPPGKLARSTGKSRSRRKFAWLSVFSSKPFTRIARIGTNSEHDPFPLQRITAEVHQQAQSKF